MKTQKCCAHCPGKLVPPRSNESHECCQPRYVSGNLRIPSLNKRVSEENYSRSKGTKKEIPELLSENRLSCYDQFATAKRLHAENLEHQPLPDKVDDSVFKNAKPCDFSYRKCCNCCKEGVRGSSINFSKRYGPALGCKEPTSKMDLAICWEAPIDPANEPVRPTHIDGSDGGLAPAIFSLVQHASSSSSKVSGHNEIGRNVGDSTSYRERCKSHAGPNCLENESKDKDDKNMIECCCNCLYKDLNGMEISRKDDIDKRLKKRSFRRCIACKAEGIREDPRLIRSAVGLALGTEKMENNQNVSKTTVPRPKTPFARRSFCIDTLAPPFSVVNGCRDADFPEHWRLMSVYQQSYKNPYRRRIYH